MSMPLRIDIELDGPPFFNGLGHFVPAPALEDVFGQVVDRLRLANYNYRGFDLVADGTVVGKVSFPDRDAEAARVRELEALIESFRQIDESVRCPACKGLGWTSFTCSLGDDPPGFVTCKECLGAGRARHAGG